MKPIGPLMIEHRLIERMIALMAEALGRMKINERLDLVFIDTVIDFIRTYADRCHHGKEEDILFRDLAKKQLSRQHRQIMDELVKEHVYARKTVGQMISGKERYLQGDKEALKYILECMQELLDFYPSHIEKEDKNFFIPVMDYFSESEQASMLQEFWDFDRQMIHKHYRQLVEQMEFAVDSASK